MRPLSFGEILDYALRIYRSLGWTLLRLTVVPAFLCLVSFEFVNMFTLKSLFETSHPNDLTGQYVEMMLGLCLGLLLGGPLVLLGVSYASNLSITIVSDYFVGGQVDAGKAQILARKNLWQMVKVNLWQLLMSSASIIASGIILLFGGWLAQATPESNVWAGILTVIGGIGIFCGSVIFLFVFAKYSLAPAVSILENVKPRASLKRSSELLKAQGFHSSATFTVIGLCFVLYIIASLLGGGIEITLALFDVQEKIRFYTVGLPFSGIITEVVDLVPTFLMIWLLIPVWSVANVLVYFDRRIRLEGYDIQALSNEIVVGGRHRFEV